MSEVPPQGQGWVDGNGYLQAGLPPVGYWQASDGRWYAPELADPAYVQPQPGAGVDPGAPTQAVPGASGQQFPPQDFGSQPYAPGPAPQQFPTGPPSGPQQFQTGPGVQPYLGGPGPVQQQPSASSRTGLWVVLGVAAALVIGILGLGTYLLVGGDEEPTAGPTTSSDAGDDAAAADDTTDDTEQTTDTTATADSVSPGLSEGNSGDVVRCTKIDDETVELEVVNNSSELSNYFLTIAFFDESGTRLSDTSGYITALRPGERTIEEAYVFDEPGSACEVIDTERVGVSQDSNALGDISSCEVTGPDFVDDVAAAVSATNSASTNSDYSVDVAILDGDGVRRGTGFAYIETVRPGETAPSDIFTTVDYSEQATCEVVAVIRSES